MDNVTPFLSTDSKTRKEKLEQVAAFSLFGNVMSMESVQLVGANRDALLLSFKDAKVVLRGAGLRLQVSSSSEALT